MANDAGFLPQPLRMYSPEILPLLQSLLATLADIDVAHRSAIEAIRSGSAEDRLKRRAIATLQERHRATRAPYIRQLEDLEERIKAMPDWNKVSSRRDKERQ